MNKLLGIKRGMTQVFDEKGQMYGVTVVEVTSGIENVSAGDVVCASGYSIGKGFAGTVKRFHDHRGPMAHGSKSHRIPGSIGSGTTPGRVWKGRNMPGRLGGGGATVKNLRVIQVVLEKNLLLLCGSVPGKRGNEVRIWKKSSAKS